MASYYPCSNAAVNLYCCYSHCWVVCIAFGRSFVARTVQDSSSSFNSSTNFSSFVEIVFATIVSIRKQPSWGWVVLELVVLAYLLVFLQFPSFQTILLYVVFIIVRTVVAAC
jgi:hypothetical protein